jgi:hypothetical protein
MRTACRAFEAPVIRRVYVLIHVAYTAYVAERETIYTTNTNIRTSTSSTWQLAAQAIG